MTLRCWAGRTGAVLMNSPATGRQLYLADRHRRQLELMWRNVQDKCLLGEQVFLTIFKMKPALQALWGLDKVTHEELRKSARFQHHAKSFGMFLDIAVSKLRYDTADLIMLARNVGKRHTCYKRVSFDAEYWLLFKNSVIDELDPYITPNICTKAHGRNLWNKFLMYLIMEMKDAFYAETRRRSSTENLSKVGTRNSLYMQLEREQRCCRSDEDVYKNSRSPTMPAPAAAASHENVSRRKSGWTRDSHGRMHNNNNNNDDMHIRIDKGQAAHCCAQSNGAAMRDRSASNFDMAPAPPPEKTCGAPILKPRLERTLSRSENDLRHRYVFDELNDVWL